MIIYDFSSQSVSLVSLFALINSVQSFLTKEGLDEVSRCQNDHPHIGKSACEWRKRGRSGGMSGWLLDIRWSWLIFKYICITIS